MDNCVPHKLLDMKACKLENENIDKYDLTPNLLIIIDVQNYFSKERNQHLEC